ncbi:PREDICTED: trypsin-7-like [Polistes dominula]|uniref:Trypsin-7-like n=1 Tax=Polistes dominula TaxID=743375 RepID=A0ABM1HZL0_POLDO|nr:PREDICTED: trypsin-7-like [Polistes dominula]
MVVNYFLSLSIILFFGSYEVNSLNPRFVGSDVASINNYPYQLSIYFGRNDVCGATIIAPKWAITSAYCLQWKIPQMINLRAGSNQTQSGGAVYKVYNFVVHPKYNRTSSEYDVALLNLTTPFVYGKTVRPIPIIQENKNVTSGTPAVITGWGYVSNSGPSFSSTLRKMVLPIIEPSFCRQEYGNKFNQNIMVCTGYEKYKKGLCSSSGYPLVANGTLIGIFSTGHGCTVSPNINTKLSAQSIRSWIKAVARV